MILLKNVLIITAIGFLSGCGDSAQEPEVLSETVIDELLYISACSVFEICTQNDFDTALEISHQQNKPTLVYITGLNNRGYRTFEKKIWPDPLVFPLLKDEFIIATIYIDDKTPMADSVENNAFEDWGEYWMNYQIERYEMVTQPVFDIVNHKNESIINEIATLKSHGTPELFKTWLEEGLSDFKSSYY